MPLDFNINICYTVFIDLFLKVRCYALNVLKRIILTLFCILFAISFCPNFVLAADDSLKIEMPSLSAVPQDTVTLGVEMTENTGVMAMSFSIRYNKDAFTFKDFTIGVFNDYTVVPHQDSGYISVIIVEGKNKKYLGNILSVTFTVNDKAEPKKHDFTIGHIYPNKYGDTLSGCFAVSTKDNKGTYSVIPEITAGSVTVGETCLNTSHIFSDFKATANPTCENEGVKSRNCTRCGHIENEKIAATGHDFEEEWTIDKVATDTAAGSMSRHCKNCSKVTDVMPFFKETAKEDNFENKEDEKIDKEDSEYIQDNAPESKPDTDQNTDTPDTDQNTDSSTKDNDNTDSAVQNEDAPNDSKDLVFTVFICLAAILVTAGIIAVIIKIKR